MTSGSSPRAVLAEAFGEPASFQLLPHDPGAPGPGQVRVNIRASGVSYVDVLTTEGSYQIKPNLPFVPGSEFSAVVETVGEGVSPSRIGERVCVYDFGNAYCEAAVVDEGRLYPMPDSMSFEEGAIFLASYSTSYHALVQRARLAAGETLLVLGAAGAVGYAACEIGKSIGARVIASASTDEKRALVRRAGADVIIDTRSPDWREEVRNSIGGRSLDVVFDPVGDVFTEAAFRSLGWGGRLLVVGFAAGSIARLPTNLALLKGAALVGVNVTAFQQADPDLARANVRDLLALYEQGQIRPPIGRTFPIEAFAEAMELARSRQIAGRVVLQMGR